LIEHSLIESRTRRTPTEIREALRAATAAPHARLHLHSGFAAIQPGTIDLVDYRSLLVRLYGFHVEFEAATGSPHERSVWLQEDLAALSVAGTTFDSRTLASIPRCAMQGAFATPARRLGARYVVEGSTLGGRELARHLAPLLGATGTAGRRFFLGRGACTGAAWQTFLEQLSVSASTPALRKEILAAAVATFEIFEQWMRAWRSDGP